MKYRVFYYLFSCIFLIPGILALVFWGVKPAIDFTGGTLLEIEINSQYQNQINKELLTQIAQNDNIDVSSIQETGKNTYLLKTKAIDQTQNTLYQQKIASVSGIATVSAVLTEKRFETLGPTMGIETLKKALIAITLAALVILLFVWRQFKNKEYGISAIIAMFHDSFITLGIFAILGHFYGIEIDTLFMTAILTTLSFSVHDTIVVYDRIRESLKKYPKIDFETIVNKACNETLGRSVNNSMTIIFMLLVLFLIGGETTKWFVLALLIGTVSGTYSSTFVAAPILVEWQKLTKRK
ncbi:protein translocase subunit SecF [Candidatus Beckwithbacteria bacterium]|nr:protein translocase subunit SecF [Candidatus Beckwithbacteria bacterium]